MPRDILLAHSAQWAWDVLYWLLCLMSYWKTPKPFIIVRFFEGFKILNEMFIEKLIFLIFVPSYLEPKGKFNHSFNSVFC